MDHYICIHGHFYQPPRENPWIEAIDLQDSAYPYHDWNRRITAECYAPNIASRILDDQGRIIRLVNNYGKISFNFGPTLLGWLEHKARNVYEAILEADLQSQATYSGHGSALAQPFNHMIMPLANRQDKVTQVIWGIRDFKHRFQRDPEGMWLPETAVDLETLDIMADQGIQFTILSPGQAARVGPLKGRDWQDVQGGKVDYRMAYSLTLPSGRSISLFFYCGDIARAVAFENLLVSGEDFFRRLLGGFDHEKGGAQLVHIATDGESYGHHHRFGEMALAYALNKIDEEATVSLTNYGEFLELYPPTREVQIINNTSWSCSHGVERWRSDCGCHTGAQPGWNQRWRGPLRASLDWLRDSVKPLFEREASKFLKDPWEARDTYIDVVLDRRREGVDHFLLRFSLTDLREDQRVSVLKLLELQRHAMLMYTSCGWFFDEFTGIETIQVLQYASRVMQLAKETAGAAFEKGFLKRLKRASSNIAEGANGKKIYESRIKPKEADLKRICAYYTMGLLFEEKRHKASYYSYTADIEELRHVEAGRATLIIGKGRFVFKITEESQILAFCALHLGDHNLMSAVQIAPRPKAYKTTKNKLLKCFEGGDFPEVLRMMNEAFETVSSLKNLFYDDQRKILKKVLRVPLSEAESLYRQLYENYAPMIRFFKESGMPVPKIFQRATELMVNADLQHAFEKEKLNHRQIKVLIEEAVALDAEVDSDTLEYTYRKTLEKLAARCAVDPEKRAPYRALLTSLNLARRLPFKLNLWTVQNVVYDIKQKVYPDSLLRAEKGEKQAQSWVRQFRRLCEKLSIYLPP
jgi:alpha-amylase/alpha-mannosidase (GH57 family)